MMELYMSEKSYTIASESDDYIVIGHIFCCEQINISIEDKTFRMSYTEAKELAQMLIEAAEEGIALAEPEE